MAYESYIEEELIANRNLLQVHVGYSNDDQGRNTRPVIIVENVLLKDGTRCKNFLYEANPDYTFFVSKPEFPLTQNVVYVEANQVDTVTCKYSDLPYEIAKRVNPKVIPVLQRLEQSGNNQKFFEISRGLNSEKHVHLTDLHLADYKMLEYSERYAAQIEPALFPIHKFFFDIEVDVYGHDGFPLPDRAPCAVNFISAVDEPTKILYILVTRDDRNDSQAEFLAKLEGIGTQKWCLQMMKEHMPLLKGIELVVFDNETSLIKYFFDIIREKKPDFAGAWNCYFDVKTLEMRLKDHLSRDPRAYLTPKEFQFRHVKVREDTFNNEKAKKADTFDITSYTKFVDLLYAYASIRIPQGKKDSYSLDAILMEELGEGKFEYEGTIQDAPFINYEKFLIYSMFDSYRLMQLEEKNKDLDLLYNMSTMTYTRFEKVMKKTTSLRNFAIKLLKDKGYVLSNNANQHTPKTIKGKFKGALTYTSALESFLIAGTS